MVMIVGKESAEGWGEDGGKRREGGAWRVTIRQMQDCETRAKNDTSQTKQSNKRHPSTSYVLNKNILISYKSHSGFLDIGVALRRTQRL